MPEPVSFMGGRVQLYLGDCREIIPLLSAFSALITDPPYGINYQPPARPSAARRGEKYLHGRSYLSGARPIVGDDRPFDPAHLLALPVPKIIWGAQNFASKLPDTNGWLAWDKTRGGTVNNGFVKSECELAWTSFLGSTRIINHMWHGMCRDSENDDRKRKHPTQKPIAVMEWCVGLLPRNPATYTILDPYMGSAPTGIAAVRRGHGFIGIEIEPKYFDIACQRIKQATAQASLALEAVA